MAILVTGGAGFIGSNFVLDWLCRFNEQVTTFDRLTYAGIMQNLSTASEDPAHAFVYGDVCDAERVRWVLRQCRPRAIIHLAAETHVDRSITDPTDFIQTNVAGTAVLLQEALDYWALLDPELRAAFRFIHVSTDEVFGSLSAGDPPFTEHTPYAPNNPYAASKAASDHLVRAYHRTYGFPAVVVTSSNNYGPRQFPEKLIPFTIYNALEGNALTVYGDGLQVRDWLFVHDHCEAIRVLLERGRPGASYNVGGNCEMQNIDVVRQICRSLDRIRKRERPHEELIQFVPDRPGHDRRYAMDASRIRAETGWAPREDFSSGLQKTIEWYLFSRPDWLRGVMSGAYHSIPSNRD